MSARGRRGSRRLLLQALYQNQVGGHECPELLDQFSTRPEYQQVDTEYFTLLLRQVLDDVESLDLEISKWSDRPAEQLDPVERGLLRLSLAELRRQPQVPAKVIINEAVELAKEFGAQDSYRFINGILDKAAAEQS